MEINLKKISGIDKFIYIIYSIYIILNINGPVWLNNISQGTILNIVLFSICLICFFIKIIIDWDKGYRISWVIIPIALFAIYRCICFKEMYLICLIIALLAIRSLNKEKLLKITLGVYIFGFIITIIGIFGGVVEDWVYYRNEVARHSLGFFYPTVAMGFYLSIVMMYVYIRKSKITLYEIIFLGILNIVLYKYTAARTSFAIITLILLIDILIKNKFIISNLKNSNTIKKLLKYSCYLLPAIMLLSILLSTLMYANDNIFAIKLDGVLSNRIRMVYEAFEKYDITLLGANIEWNGWGRIWSYE